MGHKLDLLRRVALRFLIASPLFMIQIFLIHWWPGFGVIAGLPLGFGGALIVAPRLLDLLAEPFRAVFYPLERFKKPVPMYSVPMAKRKRGDLEGALADYEVLERDYPGDLEVYQGMLELLLLEIQGREKASVVYQSALLALKKDREREQLTFIYQGMLSQLDGKPDWLKDHQERVLRPKPSDGVPVKEPDGFSAKRYNSGGYLRKDQDS